jgi:NAD+ kinase
MKVFIVSKENDTVYEKVAAKFEIVDDVFECNAVITIGGDGTILRAGGLAAAAKKPLLGINTGRLGFMATLEKDELEKLERLKNGDYKISRRMMIDADDKIELVRAINDVVLHRGESNLPEFVIFCDDVEVVRVRADGIIIATPTGSTAYSLSAGGPIIQPELECFLVTALSPHTLFNRPMVFSPGSVLRVCAEDVSVSVDGQSGHLDSRNLIITRSQNYLDLIDIDGNNFYNSIHNKLMRPLK